MTADANGWQDQPEEEREALALAEEEGRLREQMDTAMAGLGFTVQETGGGCLAYQRNLPVSVGTGYELVTDANDAVLPASLDAPVMYGLYTELRDDSGFAEARYPSLHAFLADAAYVRGKRP